MRWIVSRIECFFRLPPPIVVWYMLFVPLTVVALANFVLYFIHIHPIYSFYVFFGSLCMVIVVIVAHIDWNKRSKDATSEAIRDPRQRDIHSGNSGKA